MGSQLILFHLMLKQGFNWFTLTQEEQEIENIYLSHFFRKWQEKSILCVISFLAPYI